MTVADAVVATEIRGSLGGRDDVIRRHGEIGRGQFDVLLTPTVPTPAFKVGEKASDPLQLYLEDIFTIPANLAGLPAISVPCGKSGHLPVGFHLVGAPLSEAKLLAAGSLFEAAHGYAHQQAVLN